MDKFGQPVTEVTDVEWLRARVEQLYQIIDDISTYGDMAKSDDIAFRRLTENRIDSRNDSIESNGYSIFRKK